MTQLHVAWMYPNLLNLHGERGSIQALEQIGTNWGISVVVHRIEDFDEPIDLNKYDLLMFLPGEISTLTKLIPAMEKAQISSYVENGGHILAIGTSGLMFGNAIIREDNTRIEGLKLLDMVSKERQYVWGDDLHVRVNATKQELIGSQIQMADVDCKTPLATTLYGMGNNRSGAEGGYYKNLIYTNCLGPLLVKNPWFAESIMKDILLKKSGISQKAPNTFANDSFNSTLEFIQEKSK